MTLSISDHMASNGGIISKLLERIRWKRLRPGLRCSRSVYLEGFRKTTINLRYNSRVTRRIYSIMDLRLNHTVSIKTVYVQQNRFTSTVPSLCHNDHALPCFLWTSTSYSAGQEMYCFYGIYIYCTRTAKLKHRDHWGHRISTFPNK
jgi:hypothetical protein